MRVLLTTFEGGGHVAPALLFGRALKALGHAVLVLSDEANRAAAQAHGLAFQPWRTAPNRAAVGQSDDPLDDWRHRWPPAVVKAICRAVMTAPAGAYAADTLAAIEEFAPDVVVSNELLFGAMMAAERSRVPLALFSASVWCFPTRDDVPPFGPGFAPACSDLARQREATVRRMIAHWYDVGLDDLNGARRSIGLAPLARCLDQLEAAGLVVLGTSAAFDYGRPRQVGRFLYAGPLLGEDATPPAAHPLIDPARANVLVSFSTTYQGQEKAIARCIAALGDLPVRGIVTLGPAVPLAALSTTAAPDNVAVVAYADHRAIVPYCRAVICHGGHGTVLRPLMRGVPVVCFTMGRDHAENAQRLVSRGAGVRLRRGAGVWRIRRAISRILSEPGFAQSSGSLGRQITAERDDGTRAAQALERFGAAKS